MEFARVPDPWALTWANWHSKMSRVVPKMIRIRHGRNPTPAEVHQYESELKAREVREHEEAEPVQ
jgi:hypothetical protein